MWNRRRDLPGDRFLHLGNRWYRPAVEPNAGVGNETGPAHFTQPDSTTQLANPANANLYAYAADSPVNYIDPTGAFSLPIWLGGVGGVADGTAILYEAGACGIGAVTGAITGTVLGPVGSILGAAAGCTVGVADSAMAAGAVGVVAGLAYRYIRSSRNVIWEE